MLTVKAMSVVLDGQLFRWNSLGVIKTKHKVVGKQSITPKDQQRAGRTYYYKGRRFKKYTELLRKQVSHSIAVVTATEQRFSIPIAYIIELHFSRAAKIFFS